VIITRSERYAKPGYLKVMIIQFTGYNPELGIKTINSIGSSLNVL
jgi:hypothetical protein